MTIDIGRTQAVLKADDSQEMVKEAGLRIRNSSRVTE